MNVEIRPQRLSDAKRFFEILSNPKFLYLPAKPKTLDEEREFLRLNSQKRKAKTEFNFSILYSGKHVGAVGVRVSQFRPYIGEVGFFLDERYWGNGIATHALRKLEEFIIEKTNLSRIEMRMAIENKASERVAIKCGYEKEGILRQMLIVEDKYYDCYLYSKIL